MYELTVSLILQRVTTVLSAEHPVKADAVTRPVYVDLGSIQPFAEGRHTEVVCLKGLGGSSRWTHDSLVLDGDVSPFALR